MFFLCLLSAVASTPALRGEPATPGVVPLDTLIGADWGAFVTMKKGKASRWPGYSAKGFVSPRVEDIGAVWGKHVKRDKLSLRVLSELSHGREVNEGVSTNGMVGCYASHLKFWTEMRAHKAQRAVVFEEDAVLNPAVLGNIERAWASVPADFDVALLGYIHLRGDMIPIPGNKEWVRVKGSFWGTQGYVATANGADVLERGALPIDSQVDAYMAWNAEFNDDFKMYAPVRSLVNQGSALLYNGNVQVRRGAETAPRRSGTHRSPLTVSLSALPPSLSLRIWTAGSARSAFSRQSSAFRTGSSSSCTRSRSSRCSCSASLSRASRAACAAASARPARAASARRGAAGGPQGRGSCAARAAAASGSRTSKWSASSTAATTARKRTSAPTE
jgi:GR25 family glycosyltransferase involved in LPS biosynthesis